MAWRKWIVRGVVYGIVGAACAAALLYQRWTNPGSVREQVIAEFGKAFPGCFVSIDSARLRILGGIQITDMRLYRRDDPEKHEFLHVPSAILYHDKEKILDGELKLRKIELTRPRLRVRRQRDGNWNVKDLIRPPELVPKNPLPAIVIHQGTLIVEDRQNPDKPTSLEINDVSLTLVNDPVLRVTILGAASSDLLGKLRLHGSLDRLSHEAYLSFRAAQVPLTETLVSRLPIRCPNDAFLGLQLSATANVEGKLSYHRGQPQPIYYDISCEVLDGRVRHPKLPLPLDGLNAKLHCKNGELQLESLTARSGQTEIEASGVAQLPCIDQEFEAHLALRHVVLGQDLSKRLPDELRDLHEMFQPNGPTSIHIACARHEGQWVPTASGAPSKVTLEPESIALAFKNFPYPLERVDGKLDYNLLNEHVKIELKAHAGDRPVLLNGDWTGSGDNADVKFEIVAKDVPIDQKLMQALDTRELDELKRFAGSFHAIGKIDVWAHIRHEPNEKFRNISHLHFHEAAICWDNFPYPLTNVSGTLDIYPNQYWEFHEFQGTHNGGHVILNGKSIPKADAMKGQSHGISLEITGRNIRLDDQLRDALKPMPDLHRAWETFDPHGDLYFTASVKRPTADVHDLDVQVDVRGSSAKPLFFPYLLEDISGQFRFHERRLDIAKLRARHGPTAVAMDWGTVDLDKRGGYYADLTNLRVRGLRLDQDFLQALPARSKLQDAVRGLHLDDPLEITTRLVIAQPPETGKPPDIFWEGKAAMRNATLKAGLEFKNVTGEFACVGRYNGRQIVGVDGNFLVDEATLFDQPFKKVHAKFEMREASPDVLLIGLRAPIFGGDVVGQMRVNFHSALDYELNLTASQINVAEFGRQNLGPKSQLSGIANARLYLKGMGTGIDTLDGNGSIDIPRGHLYNLPFLLDLLKFLGLHWPDRTAFEEFHTAFAVQGSRVNVQKFDLLGSAVSLSGKGDFDLATKNLQLEIYPMWGRIEQLLPQQVRPLPTTLSKNLLTVDVRGKVSSNPKDLKFRMKPVPMVFDPLLWVHDRVIGQAPQEK